MKNVFRIIFLFMLSTFISCEENAFLINCQDCTEEEPSETELDIKIDIGEDNQEILINVYEGNLEDSVLYRSFYTNITFGFTSTTSIFVLVNKKYTVTATYYKSDNKYVAVDSATPRVKYDKEQCDNPCYIVYDRKCNLRLKYTK